jgi:hypothetical protein
MRDRKAWAFGLVALVAAPFAWGQPVEPGGPPQAIELEVMPPPFGDGATVVGDHVRIVRAGEGFETKLVKGAPYQAETVTETVQTLADGNRIVHRTTGLVARDGEGRTRREQALGNLPMFGTHGSPRSVLIHDSAAGVSYILEPEEKIARKMGRSPMFTKTTMLDTEGDEGHAGVVIRRFEHKIKEKPGEEGPARKRLRKPETESLGSKTIEGVEATGTRTTITIPAGEMGNERAIEIVSERWESPELKVVVMSRHSDPRFGETTYRLNGIVRGEPDRSLFEVPSDYTVKEGRPVPDLKIERKIREKH